MNQGPGGLVVETIAAATATAIGSLFAASDAAMREIPEHRLQALTSISNGPGAAFRRYAADPLRVLSRWLVGRVVALSSATVLLYEAARGTGLDRLALPLAVLGAVLTYGTLTEIAVTFARRRPEQVGAFALVLLRPLEWLLVPLADPLAIVGRAVGRHIPKSRALDPRVAKTEVAWAVREGEMAGAIAGAPAEMIRRVLDFENLTAREVMVPRRHIVGIELSMPLRDVTALVVAKRHARYPVYRENLDTVVGWLHARDLFAAIATGRETQLKLFDVMRIPLLFVSESQSATKLLQDMRSRRLHMAIVSDDFGGTAGLVTIEDVLEEIVGDLRDGDEVEAPIQSMADGHVVADASMAVADLAKALGKHLPDDGEFESVGGLVVSRAGRVPAVGTSVDVDGLTFIVREADETRVVKVEVIHEAVLPQGRGNLPP